MRQESTLVFLDDELHQENLNQDSSRVSATAKVTPIDGDLSATMSATKQDAQYASGADSASSQGRTLSRRFLYMSQACDAWVYSTFEKLGKKVHDNAKRFLIIPMILMIPLIAGMSQMERVTEDDPSKLFVPENTQASQDTETVEAAFGLSDSVAAVYGVANPEGGNMLTTDNMLTLYDAWDNISTATTTSNGNVFNLSGVCRKINGECQKSTVLAFWQYNRSLIASQTDAELWQTIVDANYVATEQDGREVNLSVVAYVQNNEVISTKFTIVTEALREDDDGTGNSKKVERWELLLRDVVRDNTWGSLKLYSDSQSETSEEASGPLSNDLVLLPIGYILLLLYATVVLSRNSKVHSHGSLAWASFAASGVAIGASFGAGMWMGITFANIILTLAFLLIGIGTDDTFVIVSAFQHPDVVDLEPRARVAAAMARAGSSIAVTSLTDLIAFLAGSITTIPVVRAFCQYAAIGVTLDFFLQVTFFAAAMFMSAQREEADRLDWLCCFLSGKPEATCVGGKGKEFDRSKPEMMTVFMSQMYSPRLLTPGGKVVAFLVGGLFLCLNIWACTQVEMDFQFEWFVSDDSYLQDTFEVRDRYWGRLGAPASIYTFDGDYSAELTQTQFSKMTTALDGNDDLISGSCVNWWPAFIDFAETNATSSMRTVDGERIVDSLSFDDTVLNFYNDDAGASFTDYIVFSSSNEITRTQIPCLESSDGKDMTGRISAMDRMREIADIVSSVGGIALGPGYWIQDAHKVFLREIIINLALAIVGVFIVTTVMLGSLLPSMLVTFMLIIIDIEVLGSIYLSGDYFNTVTGINLVLAVGLSVDAVAHITHSFLAHDGTGNERSHSALTELGRSVFNGAISTMIVLVPLAGADSYVFQVFFRTFLAIIGYSAFNGLVVLPVLLSLVRPTSFSQIRGKLGLEQDRHKTGTSNGDVAVNQMEYF
mmetsp:Transcript_115102/g.161775  ORF Transcript_115102/g.161775 Transcript_115102/m.161775 type:complete len:942 (-) Transcript_115102:122-2947(-)